MCGRFAQPRSPDELARIFRATAVSDLPGDRFNVAPTDPVAAVVEHHGERVVDTFRWGLVPFFAEGPKSRSPLINARAETVETAPAFRTSFARRRCIVPAEAFYEWRRHRDPETNRIVRSEPFAIRRRTGEPLAFAGVWAIWRNRETAERLYSLAIVTGPPNGLVATVHDRMPIVLDPGDWDTWLDEGAKLAELRPLLRPYPAGELLLYPVSPAVNNVRSSGAELLLPLTRWGRRRVIIALPPDALVLLVGPSGAGKSTFASRHFAPTEVLSSDAMRAMVADDPMDQAATDAAFELLHTALAMRLSLRRLAVVDATNVEGWARETLLSIARRARRPAHAIAFDLPLEVCLHRNQERDHPRPAAAIRRQHRWMTQSLPSLANEGLDAVWTISTEQEAEAAQISRIAPALSS